MLVLRSLSEQTKRMMRTCRFIIANLIRIVRTILPLNCTRISSAQSLCMIGQSPQIKRRDFVGNCGNHKLTSPYIYTESSSGIVF